MQVSLSSFASVILQSLSSLASLILQSLSSLASLIFQSLSLLVLSACLSESRQWERVVPFNGGLMGHGCPIMKS